MNNRMNFTNLKRLLLSTTFILFIPFLQSCSSDYCSQIVSKINDKYQQESKEEIILDLNEVFDFEWDTIYVCGPYGFDQEISNSIGFESKYDYVSEGETLFSFLKNNVVIEEMLIDCDKMGFVRDSDKEECLEIKSSNAKFKVKNLAQGDGQNYLLRRLN